MKLTIRIFTVTTGIITFAAFILGKQQDSRQGFLWYSLITLAIFGITFLFKKK